MERLVFERDIGGKRYRICVRSRPFGAAVITYQVSRALNGRDMWQGVPASWDGVRSVMDEAFAGDLAPFRVEPPKNGIAA